MGERRREARSAARNGRPDYRPAEKPVKLDPPLHGPPHPLRGAVSNLYLVKRRCSPGARDVQAQDAAEPLGVKAVMLTMVETEQPVRSSRCPAKLTPYPW